MLAAALLNMHPELFLGLLIMVGGFAVLAVLGWYYHSVQ